MTRSFARVLVAAFFTAAASTVGVAQEAQPKQDTVKKTTPHDMSKMKDHDMSQKKDHDMSKMMERMGGSWKEMNTFHLLLAATYHPASKDTLQPLRDKGADLAAAATTWAGSAAPASCNTDDIRQRIATLSSDARVLAAQVQAKASDADLRKGITALHAIFESVEMKCGGHDMKEMKH